MMNKQIKSGRSKSIFSKKQVQQKWVGEIVAKKQKKVYKNNEFHGNLYYKLIVIKEGESNKQSIFVYPNLVSREIFRVIEKNDYIYKKYLFFCERAKWGWILHSWQELNPNLSTLKSKNLSENYEKK